jgi:DNA 3'-phosphatase
MNGKTIVDLTTNRHAEVLVPLGAAVTFDGSPLRQLGHQVDAVVITRDQFDAQREPLERASFGADVANNPICAALVNALVSSRSIVTPEWVERCRRTGSYQFPLRNERLDLDMDSAGMQPQTSSSFEPAGPDAAALVAEATIPDAEDEGEAPALGDVGFVGVPANTATAQDIAPYNLPGANTLVPDLWRVMQCCELNANKNKYYCIEVHRHPDPQKSFAGEHVIVTRYGRTDDLVGSQLSGRRDLRYFPSLQAARAAFEALIRQKHQVKGYVDVDLLSCKIGTAQLQRVVEAKRDERRASTHYDPFDPAQQVDPAAIDFVDALYREAEAALSKAIIAKITPLGVETPLGALDETQIIKGFQVLSGIEAALVAVPTDHTAVRTLTSQYFSLVPQHLGRTNVRTKIIDSRDALLRHREVLQLASDLIKASMKIPASSGNDAAAMRRLRLAAIPAKVTAVTPASPEWAQVTGFVESEKCRVRCHVRRIFAIRREAESGARARAQAGNPTTFLAHGSRASNWYGILSRGLLLPKDVEKLGVPRTNVGWLGAGLYFADACCTTTRYATPSGTDGSTRYVAVANVQLGRIFETTKIDTTLTAAPAGYDSVKALGSEQGGPATSDFQDNEYCIYEQDRHHIEYVVEFTTDSTLPPPHQNVALSLVEAKDIRTMAQAAAVLAPKFPPAFKQLVTAAPPPRPAMPSLVAPLPAQPARPSQPAQPAQPAAAAFSFSAPPAMHGAGHTAPSADSTVVSVPRAVLAAAAASMARAAADASEAALLFTAMLQTPQGAFVFPQQLQTVPDTLKELADMLSRLQRGENAGVSFGQTAGGFAASASAASGHGLFGATPVAAAAFGSAHTSATAGGGHFGATATRVLFAPEERLDGPHGFTLSFACNGFAPQSGTAAPSVCGFDLDHTLIRPRNGRKFPHAADDLELCFPQVVSMLQRQVSAGNLIVIFSNQLFVHRQAGDNVEVNINRLRERTRHVATLLGVPFLAVYAVAKDKARKPNTGMWDWLRSRLPGANMMCFVGDAAGRPTDFSADDSQFAANVSTRHYLPEAFFPLFAGGGGFGQQPAPSAPSAPSASGSFGQPPQAGFWGGFGQPPAGTGGFGQPAPSTGGFSFNLPAPTAFGGGGFGQPPAGTGGFSASGFGQPAPGGFGGAHVRQVPMKVAVSKFNPRVEAPPVNNDTPAAWDSLARRGHVGVLLRQARLPAGADAGGHERHAGRLARGGGEHAGGERGDPAGGRAAAANVRGGPRQPARRGLAPGGAVCELGTSVRPRGGHVRAQRADGGRGRAAARAGTVHIVPTPRRTS